MTAANKIRIYELDKEVKQEPKRVIEDARKFGVDVSVPSNSVPKEVADWCNDEAALWNQVYHDKERSHLYNECRAQNVNFYFLKENISKIIKEALNPSGGISDRASLFRSATAYYLNSRSRFLSLQTFSLFVSLSSKSLLVLMIIF